MARGRMHCLHFRGILGGGGLELSQSTTPWSCDNQSWYNPDRNYHRFQPAHQTHMDTKLKRAWDYIEQRFPDYS